MNKKGNTNTEVIRSPAHVCVGGTPKLSVQILRLDEGSHALFIEHAVQMRAIPDVLGGCLIFDQTASAPVLAPCIWSQCLSPWLLFAMFFLCYL